MAAKRFAVPFATTGDKVVIPDAVDSQGAVSYSEGWGPDYQLPDDDPAYRPVGRQEMNGVLNDITGAIAEVQQNGVATWVQPAGLIPPYPVNALVRHNDKVWLNNSANNSAEPSVANGWVDVFGNGFVPPGAVMSFATPAAPNGYLLCDGSAISRTTYASLFSAIGTAFGAGNGSTTFNVPDMRGMFVRGLDQGRGVDPGRTLSNTPQNPANLAHSHAISVVANGAHTHALSASADSAGAHTHSVSGSTNSAGAHTHTAPRAANNDVGNGSPNFTTANGLNGTTAATNSAGSHTHTVSGTAASAGTHTHTVSGTATSAGSHTHDASATTEGAAESRPYNIALVYCIKF